MGTYGVMMFPTDYAIQPVELAKAVEERGLDSLFFPEHTHIPTSRRSPWPGGGELPQEYSHTHDLFVALSAAAAVTKRIMLGTGICLVIERDPILLAKEVASLDLISNGRVILGIGGGWNAEEIENHGTVFATRMQKMREQIEAMKAIWTQSKPEYHGDIVQFDTMMTWPKPVQKPHPPVILGGAFPWAARRAVRYGDGWYPNAASGNPEEYVPAFRKMAQEAGRNPASLSLRLGGAPDDADKLKHFRDIGVDAVNVTLMSETKDQLLPVLDHWAGHIRQLRG